ncbi:uncharacterized protein EAF02_005037 [Botrytis sinoallii]|uniref:uncharacterized protein n=1 Tax=Botrytis sinoallii TaxID=1463999 RepID=UPI0019013A7D|nr:uncharacterized protein EAF02_005037 [Botrytis sinoallii]KAF7884701.1 hypothetical protein EAF02_005037 [Botrytis sinoallii]
MSSRRSFEIFNASNINKNADQFERDIAPVLAHDAIRAESSVDLRNALNATLKLEDINKRLPDVLTEEDAELLEITLDKTDPDSLKLQESMRNLVSQVTPKLEMQMELLLSTSQGKIVDLTSKNETYKVELDQMNAQLIALRTGTNLTDAMKDLSDSHYKAKEKLTEGKVDLKTTSDLYKKIGALESRKDNLKRDLSITNTNLLSMTKERDNLRTTKANHEQIERESKRLAEQCQKNYQRRIRDLEEAIQASKLNLEREKAVTSGLAARLSEEENKSKGLQKDIDDLRNRPVLAADMHAGRSNFLEKIELEGAKTTLQGKNELLTMNLNNLSKEMVNEKAKSAQIPGLETRIRTLQEDMEKLSTSHHERYQESMKSVEEAKANLVQKEEKLEEVNKILDMQNVRQNEDATKLEQQIALIKEKDARIDTLLIRVQNSDSLQGISEEYAQCRAKWDEEKIQMNKSKIRLEGELRVTMKHLGDFRTADYKSRRVYRALEQTFETFKTNAENDRKAENVKRMKEFETERRKGNQIQMKLDGAVADLENTRKAYQIAQKRIENLEATQDKVIGDCFNKSEGAGFLKGQVDLLQNQVNSLQGQVKDMNSLQDRIKELVEENSYLDILIAQEEISKKTREARNNERLSRLEETLRAHQRQIASLRSEVETKTQEIKHRDEEISRYCESIIDYTNKIGELRKRVNEVSNERSELACKEVRFHCEVTAATKAKDQFESKYKSSQKLNEDLQNELNSLKTAHSLCNDSSFQRQNSELRRKNEEMEKLNYHGLKTEITNLKSKLTTMVPRSDLDTLQAQFDTLKTEANKDRTSLASVVTQEDHEAILQRVRTVYENASKDLVPKVDLESTQKRFNAVDRAQSQPQVNSKNGFQAGTSIPVTPSSTRHHTGMDLSHSRASSTFTGFNSGVPLPGPNSTSETLGHGVNLGIENGQQLSIPPQNMDIPLTIIEQSPQPARLGQPSRIPRSPQDMNMRFGTSQGVNRQQFQSPMPPNTGHSSRAQTPSHIPLPAFGRQYVDSMLPQPGYSSRAQMPSLPPPTFSQQFGNPMTPGIGHLSRAQTPLQIPAALDQQARNYMTSQPGSSSRAQTPSHIPISVQAGGMMTTSRQSSIQPHNRCMFLISGTVNQGPRTLQVLPELIDKIQMEIQDWDSHPSNTKRRWDRISKMSADRFACPYCVENRKLCVLVSLSGPVIAPLPINSRSVDANPTTRGYCIKEI